MRKLLLHVCCAACSTHAIEVFRKQYDLTLHFYNPCIMPKEEYETRLQATREYAEKKQIPLLVGDLDVDDWLDFIKGHEEDKEGGERCTLCYEFRLRKTAEKARSEGYDLFTTTLTISPHKNARTINEIGQTISEEVGVEFLEADLKKKDGFRKSVVLCREHDVYRQDYCGCTYSM